MLLEHVFDVNEATNLAKEAKKKAKCLLHGSRASVKTESKRV